MILLALLHARQDARDVLHELVEALSWFVCGITTSLVLGEDGRRLLGGGICWGIRNNLCLLYQ